MDKPPESLFYIQNFLKNTDDKLTEFLHKMVKGKVRKEKGHRKSSLNATIVAILLDNIPRSGIQVTGLL